MVGQHFSPGNSTARISGAKRRPAAWPGRCEKVPREAPGGSLLCGSCDATAVGFSSPSEGDVQNMGTINDVGPDIARRNTMNEEPLAQIEREVTSWPGVTTGDTGRGGLQFSYGRIELGHLHGSSFADLPFPKKVRDQLIAQGRASVHDPLPNSGWVRRSMYAPEDVEAVIGLFRMNYDRAKERAGRSSARQG